MCDNLASMLDTKNEFIAICPPFDANQQYHVYGMLYILNDERKKVTFMLVHHAADAVITIKPI